MALATIAFVPLVPEWPRGKAVAVPVVVVAAGNGPDAPALAISAGAVVEEGPEQVEAGAALVGGVGPEREERGASVSFEWFVKAVVEGCRNGVVGPPVEGEEAVFALVELEFDVLLLFWLVSSPPPPLNNPSSPPAAIPIGPSAAPEAAP